MRLWCLGLFLASYSLAVTIPQAQLGSSASEDTCAITKPDTSFPVTTRQVFLRFVANSLRSDDHLTVDWIDPSGSVHSSITYDELPPQRSLCLLTQIPIGGFPAAQKPGEWTARISTNGRAVTALRFQLSGSGTSSSIQITNITTKDLSPTETEIIIDGAGFNTESIIHLAQYTNSGGWSYIAYGFPKTLAANRVTFVSGPLKPAEYVIFIRNGQVLGPPGRFLINTAGYKMPFPPSEQWVISQTPYGGYSHWGRTTHAYDIAPRAGGCVVAMRPGVVSTFDHGYGQTPKLRIFGNYITIQHDDGEYSHYGHLRTGSFRVKTGERVEAGQALAIAGNSGYSFGTHVHVQVTKEFRISAQSIPFEFEEFTSAHKAAYRGAVASSNRSNLGSCSGSKPNTPIFLNTSTKQQGNVPPTPPTWSASVALAGWWSEFTAIPKGTKSLEIRLGWDDAARDLDLHLVSPSGKHYGSYGDRSGYTPSTSTEEAFVIPDPEPGTWRVSVQGIRGTGEEMPFRVYRNVGNRSATAWGGKPK